MLVLRRGRLKKELPFSELITAVIIIIITVTTNMSG